MSLGGSLAHVGVAIEGHQPYIEEVWAALRVCYARESDGENNCKYHTVGKNHPFNKAMEYFEEKLNNKPERFLGNPYFDFKTGEMVALEGLEICTDDAPGESL
jgi:hypothetical protein